MLKPRSMKNSSGDRLGLKNRRPLTATRVTADGAR
jgi:hypothetical protein